MNIRNIKAIGLAVTTVGSLLLVACQSASTGAPKRLPNQLAVSARIKKNSKKYSQLSSTQKSAISKGTVSKGMKKDAVRLAWGKPDKVQQTSSSGGKKELWIYYSREQVDLDYQSPFGALGRFYTDSQRYREGFTNTELRTVQRVDRTVSFYNDRVLAWTRTRY